jgi:ABC-type transporter Mla subunit MlaD
VLKNRERWLELAELAATEQDPDKLMALISEINQLLAQKQDRLNRLVPKPPDP